MTLPPPVSLERTRRFSGNARIGVFWALFAILGHSNAASGEPIGRVLPGFSPEPLLAVRFRQSVTGHYDLRIARHPSRIGKHDAD